MLPASLKGIEPTPLTSRVLVYTWGRGLLLVTMHLSHGCLAKPGHCPAALEEQGGGGDHSISHAPQLETGALLWPRGSFTVLTAREGSISSQFALNPFVGGLKSGGQAG